MTTRQRVATIVTLGLLGALAGTTTASAGGAGHCENAEARGTRVVLAEACFTPTTLFADPGATITFVNEDPFAHNVSGAGWGHYDDMGQGSRFTMSFADEGVYAYACTLHPGMTGSIVVGEGDSGATVAAAGDVPPSTTPAEPAPESRAWMLAGAVGLLIGGVAGAGIASTRRRTAGSGIETEASRASSV
jgi:plastocyanin